MHMVVTRPHLLVGMYNIHWWIHTCVNRQIHVHLNTLIYGSAGHIVRTTRVRCVCAYYARRTCTRLRARVYTRVYTRATFCFTQKYSVPLSVFLANWMYRVFQNYKFNCLRSKGNSACMLLLTTAISTGSNCGFWKVNIQGTRLACWP